MTELGILPKAQFLFSPKTAGAPKENLVSVPESS